jgi:hypothetical protein
MRVHVTFSAQSDEVLFHVATGTAPEFEVVYLQVLNAAANLASPVVALQNLLVQSAITLGIESESWA